MARFVVVLLALSVVGHAVGLTLPHSGNLTVSAGTTMGFELSASSYFDTLEFPGSVDCIYFKFLSSEPISAELYFDHWDYLRGLALNRTNLPEETSVPGSRCNKVTDCEVDFKLGQLPVPENTRYRSGFSPIPYTVVIWTDINMARPAEVKLVVDTPCYANGAFDTTITTIVPRPAPGQTVSAPPNTTIQEGPINTNVNSTVPNPQSQGASPGRKMI